MGSADLRRQRFNDAKPIALEHVLFFDYAYAEMLEPGRWNPDAAQLAGHVAQIGGPAHLPPEERRSLIDRICRHREPMLGFLLRNSTAWFAGSFDVDAIGALRLTRWFEQPQFANARTIDELLESLGGASYAKLDFSLDAMRGRPIMVAADLAGPYCLIEGTLIVAARWSGLLVAAQPHDPICSWRLSQHPRVHALPSRGRHQRRQAVVGASRRVPEGCPAHLRREDSRG